MDQGTDKGAGNCILLFCFSLDVPSYDNTLFDWLAAALLCYHLSSLTHTHFTFDLTLRPQAPDHKAGYSFIGDLLEHSKECRSSTLPGYIKRKWCQIKQLNMFTVDEV